MEDQVALVTEKEVILSDGRKSIISKGKGKHVREATKIAGTDESKYMFAMIAQVTTIDGKGIVMEDLDDLSMNDVIAIQTAFAELNF